MAQKKGVINFKKEKRKKHKLTKAKENNTHAKI